MREIDGIIYDDQAPEAVINALELARESQQRIRLWYGDPETGESWEVETDNIGYISANQWGLKRLPVLVHNARTDIGIKIYSRFIVKAQIAHVPVYKHPKFNQPVYDVIGNAVHIGDEVHKTFETEDQAQRWVDWMYGKRMGTGGPSATSTVRITP